MPDRYLILTCMKNEGPFILEWVAYHLSIGFDHLLVYSNDCEDGTDAILDRLALMGVLTHRDNAYAEGQRKSHQVRAYRAAPKEQAYQDADWVAVIDADEFINVHTGDHSIRALTAAVPQSQCISMTWRLFGSGDQTFFNDDFLTEKLRRAAPHHCPSPIQAWGMKTLHRTKPIKVVGCHRPKKARHDDWDALNWVNGSGDPMPASYHKGSWRMNRHTAGYKLAQINHYALRTRENYLMKVVRGRAYTPDILGADYWHNMNRNEEADHSIQPRLPAAKEAYEALLADPVLRKLHKASVKWHRNAIDKVAASEMGRRLMEEITPKMELFGRKRAEVAA